MIIDPVITYSTYAGSVNSDAFTGDHDSGNDIAVDAAGNINVVWEDDTANNSNILFGRSTDGGLTFLTQPLSNTVGYSYSPRICVDSKGDINVVWVDDTTGNPVVHFSRSTNGGATFSACHALAHADDFGAIGQRRRNPGQHLLQRRGL